MVELYRSSSIEWKPSPVVALATSTDNSQVAAAREDGSLEIWLVSPGSVGWHHQLTIHGNSNYRISSLLWCRCGSNSTISRLFSSSIDGSVFEWDLFQLKQKVALESIGISIWQMAIPSSNQTAQKEQERICIENGFINGKLNQSSDDDSSDSGDEANDAEYNDRVDENTCVAVGCDDGCVRMYHVSDSNSWTYYRSLPRVSGRILSVVWSSDAKNIYAGSNDGTITCWDANLSHEIYRITVSLGEPRSRSELCIWSLLVLRCGMLVSADSAGSVQFWDTQHGTLLQAHSYHKGDVNALAASPNQKRVFSAGSDGQVILYKLSNTEVGTDDRNSLIGVMKQWAYIGYVRAHTHDIKALTVAVPICYEDIQDKKVKRLRRKEKPVDFSYHKWAHMGVPMLISGGDDAKIFAYSVMDFTKFSPHDICPAPQRVPIQLVLDTSVNQNSLLLAQKPYCIDIYNVQINPGIHPDSNTQASSNSLKLELLAQVKSKASRKIVCSTISNSGVFFAYSDHVRLSLFEFKERKHGSDMLAVVKRELPKKLPFAHSMIFSADSSQLLISGHDRRIYVVDVRGSSLLYTFTPSRDVCSEGLAPTEPPITKMFCSSDGQWLASVNCFGDVYVFSLELQRQHWFISRLDGAAVTAAGFPPQNSNALVIATSSNQVYSLDVESKQLGEWSTKNTFFLPKRYQEFPGEVVGLSFLPSAPSPAVIIYSSRAMCVINFATPVTDTKPISPINGKMKRKLHEQVMEGKLFGRKNFEFCTFRDPVLFVGHISKSAVLIVDKPWLEVVKTFESMPVHRHIYGT